MQTERWQQVEKLFHAALERAPHERLAYLRETSGDDLELQREVESLLTAHEASGRLETAASDLAAEWLKGEQPPVGRTLGHFQILAHLGSGGMGDVYLAEDNRLHRKVALKLLSEDSAREEGQLRRFEREALAASALNHPNIVTIYEIDEADGVQFIATEFVEGETLRALMTRERLELAKVLDIAEQIANALQAAHAAGIIHRDIKPENIMVRSDGLVKVLDFGLAKLIVPQPATVERHTIPGMVMGTAAYMSPEQARGLELDARTDIFSLGVVLYEMIAGKAPFQGLTRSDVLASLLKSEPPPLSDYLSEAPRELEQAVSKALRKDREERYQTVVELWRELRNLRQTVGTGYRFSGSAGSGESEAERAEGHANLERSGGDSESKQPAAVVRATTALSRWRVAPYATAAGALILLLGYGVGVRRWNTTNVPPRSEWMQLTNFTDSVTQPALSPDGRMLTFIRGESTFYTVGQIYVKLLPDGAPVQLTHDSLRKMSPVFSPDGSRIAYTIVVENWDTWVVPALGGEPRPMLPNASGLTWIGSRRLLFSEIKKGIHMAIVTATENRSDARDIYVPAHERGMGHRSYLSPDGKWVLLVEMDNRGFLPCRLVPFDGSSDGRPVGPIPGACTFAAWSPDGKWMYFTSNAGGSFHVWRQRFSGGTPEQVTFGPTEEEGIALAPDGRSLVTSVGLRQSALWIHDANGERQITAEGYAELSSSGFGAHGSCFSPDGKKFYYLVRQGSSGARVAGEIWEVELDSGRSERFLDTVATGFDISSDGKRMVLAAEDKDGISYIWIASLTRDFGPRRLPLRDVDNPLFGPDANIYFRAKEGKLNFLYRVKEDGIEPQKVISDPILGFFSISPDGEFVLVTGGFVAAQSPGEDTWDGLVAYPTRGGTPLRICRHGRCSARWTDYGNFFDLALSTEGTAEEWKTYIIALKPGQVLPDFPSSGVRSEADLRGLPVVQKIATRARAPSPNPDMYAFTRKSTHRNLYRIPLP